MGQNNSGSLAPLESLLTESEGNDAQLFLTLGDLGFAPGKIDRTLPAKRYTGAVLFREKPELYRAIVVLGAEPGMSVRRICKIVHCTHDTVTAVLAREPLAVSAHRKELLNTARIVQRTTLERLGELAPSMNAKEASLSFGIVSDKHELLSGGVTARVEITDGASVLKRFLDLHERIEKTVRGEVIETAPENGSPGKNPALNAPAVPSSFEPITSDNKRHIKSKSVEPESLTTIEADSYNLHNEAPCDSAPADGSPAGGGTRPRDGGRQPHPLIQPEIL